MNELSPEALARIEFRVSFEHEGVRHTNCRYAQRVNLWRDLLPRKLYEGLMGKQPGDRVVKHIDDATIDVISGLYGKLIRPDSDVLDLMSSWIFHVPADLQLRSLTGLGMNPGELQANRRLTDHVVHDLNKNPCLPFNANTFDAVICTVSVEYLTRPFEVFEDLARVLKPGGLLVHTVSNRWFPPKVIRIWPQLHEFERMGLILEYFLSSGRYCDLQTYSLRGLPRPEDDPYYGKILESDPVYAVWGRSCE